jgi:hypothetical protein
LKFDRWSTWQKIDGIPLDGHWRVVKRTNGKWRTWLVAFTNIWPGNDPLYPQTEEQDACAIFETVSGKWPEKEWAIIDPDHNFADEVD